jgi:stage II sporulation protein GA (sporulation sigma-E factor processing peptidase)
MTAMEIFSNVILKVLLSIAIISIAFNPKKLKELGKELMIFYLTSFTFGGVAFALLYFVKPQNILLKNGTLIGTYPIIIILTGGIAGFIMIVTAFKNIKGKLSKKDITCDVMLIIDLKKVYIKAIIDTGNFLKDPITKAPVIVVEKTALYEALPKELLDNLEHLITGTDINLDEYMAKIRLIPFTSLGKENGILIGLKTDLVKVNYDNKEFYVQNAIMGIYNGHLSKNDKYEALIGLDMLENEGGTINEYFASIKG